MNEPNLTVTLTPELSRSTVELQRSGHLDCANSLFCQAKVLAEVGSFREAGCLILRGLDQERRASSSGPQVLQLIKPRL